MTSEDGALIRVETTQLVLKKYDDTVAQKYQISQKYRMPSLHRSHVIITTLLPPRSPCSVINAEVKLLN